MGNTHAETTTTQPGGCCGRGVPALSTAPDQAHVHLLKADSTAQRGSAAGAASSRNARPRDLLMAPGCWGRRRRLLAEHPAISSHQAFTRFCFAARRWSEKDRRDAYFQNTVHFLRVTRSHGELLLPSHLTELRAHRCHETDPSFSGKLKLISDSSDAQKGCGLNEKPHLSLLDDNPRFGFYCDARERTSPSNDTDIPAPSRPAPVPAELRSS